MPQVFVPMPRPPLPAVPQPATAVNEVVSRCRPIGLASHGQHLSGRQGTAVDTELHRGPLHEEHVEELVGEAAELHRPELAPGAG